MKEQTKTQAEIAHEQLQKKLMKMLDELPLDSDEEGGCGHGCSHDHDHR